MELKKLLEKHKSVENQIIEALIKELDEIKENPDINRINSNCFTVKLSDLQPLVSLSPEYYDTDFQRNEIIRLMQTAQSLDSKINILRNIAADKKYKQIKFYPKVCQVLKCIVEEIDSNNNNSKGDEKREICETS